MSAELVERAWQTIEQVRRRRPLVHQITNLVVMNDTANATLALGGRPVMALDPAEVAEMAAQADALVLNLGTPAEERFTALARAGIAANDARKPIVIDPVGYGATTWRTARADALLEQVRPSLVRGNAGEIMQLCGAFGRVSGVDSAGAAADLEAIARNNAREWGYPLAISGAVDVITDGHRLLRIANGTPLLSRITGAGCIGTALAGCCLAVQEDALLAALAASLALAIAGELAAGRCAGPGSFRVALIDAIANLDHDAIRDRARVTIAS